MIKAIMNGVPKDIVRIPMFVNGVEHEGWEVRDQQGAILWAANKTLTGTNSIPMKGYGLPLVSMTLEGNETQTGTPTPDSPIWPEECGDKTVNLFDKDNYNILQAYFPSLQGTVTLTYESANRCVWIPCKPNTAYTASRVSGKRFAIGCAVDTPAAGVTVYNVVGSSSGTTNLTTTTTADANYLVVYLRNGNISGETSLQIVEGSQPLPYEPYGKYKLPLTLNGVTQNIYLSDPLRKIGEYADKVSSTNVATRPIAKMILTGQETTWRLTGSGRIAVRIGMTVSIPDNASCLCTHFVGTSATSFSAIGDGECSAQLSGSGGYREIGFYSTTYSTLEDFKQYVTTQYAAGTPVCVWYVLATPTTEQVTIPTLTPADGNDTLTVNTTLAPSALSITGHVKARTV